MKSDFLEFIGNARQRRSEKLRNQLPVFIVCLVLSVLIWALVRLSKDYYYSVEYRLNWTQVPGNLKLAGYSDLAEMFDPVLRQYFQRGIGILFLGLADPP